MRAISLYLLISISTCVATAWAQEIHIRVVNGRSGKAITNECLNISFGNWRGAELLVPTNGQGIIVLHIRGMEVTADAVSAHACSGQAILGPRVFDDLKSISVMGDFYVVCQEYGKVVRGQSPPSDRIPAYPIAKILESGVTAANTCGKFRAEAQKGELLFFVRPLSFWEKMKS
jgi:hypothetical protein